MNPSSHQLGTNEMMTLILKAYVIKVCHDCHTKHHLFDLDLEKYGLSSVAKYIKVATVVVFVTISAYNLIPLMTFQKKFWKKKFWKNL